MVKVTVQKGGKQKKTRSGSDFIDNISPISRPESGMKVLLYGRSGTGKTRTACTFPKPLLLVRAEEGTRSVYTVKGVDTTPIMSHPDELGELCEFLSSNKPHYKTVVLDTGGAYYSVLLRNIIGGDLPQQLSFGEVSREDYAQASLEFKERLNTFYNLADTANINVIVTAQERGGEEDEYSERLLLPTVGGDFSTSIFKWINPKADYIACTFIQRVKIKVKKKGKTLTEEHKKYCLRVGPDPIYITKFRVPEGVILPDYIVDPTYDKIHTLAYPEG